MKREDIDVEVAKIAQHSKGKISRIKAIMKINVFV